jgi:V/A-type H+-transporting ATPase subunit E
MGLNKVSFEIRENARREAQKIISEGKGEGQKLMDEARARLKEQEKAMRQDMELALRQIELRSQTIVKRQTKEFAMNAKKELVERVYLEFLDYLKGMKGDERSRIFRKMLNSARGQIAKPKYVHVRKEDVTLAKKLFRGLEIRTKEMDGGFIVESADGRELIDLSFETLIEQLKGRTLKGVSKTLFGE